MSFGNFGSKFDIGIQWLRKFIRHKFFRNCTQRKNKKTIREKKQIQDRKKHQQDRQKQGTNVRKWYQIRNLVIRPYFPKESKKDLV